MKSSIYSSLIKPFLDVLVALMGFIILSPIFILLSVIFAIDYKGSPFFLQSRPGKNEKIFKIIKFKTMNDKKDAQGILLPNRQRITSLGLLARKYSLDEIPQLINVIIGDMSFVGPRPLEVKYLPFYNATERLRHSVRPGITGLAQVNGRNNLVWEDRFALDVEYAQNQSFALDFTLMVQTFLKLFKKSEVAVDQDEFLDYFNVYRQKQWDALTKKTVA